MICAAIGLIAGISNAEQLRVPQQYPSINKAIDAASDGDSIVVGPGIWNEAINFSGKTLILRSAQGPASTILDGTGLNTSIVQIASGEELGTQIRGFTFINGTGRYFLGERVAGAIFTLQTSPRIENCVFKDNDVTGSGGAIASYGGAPEIRNCDFTDNIAGTGEGGGAIATNSGCEARIQNCYFTRNKATFAGGAINNLISSPTIVNCVFIGNEAALGGAVRNSLADTIVVNCSFLTNIAQYGGAVRSSSGGSPVVANSAFSDNFPDDVFELAGAETSVSYCCLQYEWNGLGSDNIVADPRFIDPRGDDGIIGSGDENVRVLLISPCIDAGDNSAVPDGVNFDPDGRSRFLDSDLDGILTVEIGAYEAPGSANPADLNGDGVVDTADLLLLLSYWGECENEEGCLGDLDNDGYIGVEDILVLLQYWNFDLLGDPMPLIETFLGDDLAEEIFDAIEAGSTTGN